MMGDTKVLQEHGDEICLLPGRVVPVRADRHCDAEELFARAHWAEVTCRDVVDHLQSIIHVILQ